MRYPGELYRPSDRAYHHLDSLEYPFHDLTGPVTMRGRDCVALQADDSSAR